mmetsp:Transcript_13925/g.52210  ORF Transcript_13925/g.52210 Transcript_13925/m.52210 type:complete len:209 (-) Transcript_13925:1162-1788(-)
MRGGVHHARVNRVRVHGHDGKGYVFRLFTRRGVRLGGLRVRGFAGGTTRGRDGRKERGKNETKKPASVPKNRNLNRVVAHGSRRAGGDLPAQHEGERGSHTCCDGRKGDGGRDDCQGYCNASCYCQVERRAHRRELSIRFESRVAQNRAVGNLPGAAHSVRARRGCGERFGKHFSGNVADGGGTSQSEVETGHRGEREADHEDYCQGG